MRFIPTGYNCKYTLSRDAEVPEGAFVAKRERAIVWQVRSDRMDHVRLYTGEWLADIGGSVRVQEAPPFQMERGGGMVSGMLGYHNEHGYQVVLCVSEREFDRLLDLVRAAKIPELSIELPMHVDGLETVIPVGTRWNVETRRWVEVLWWNFLFPLGPSGAEADEKKPQPTTLTNVVDAVNERGRALLKFGWLALAAVAVALWLLRR